MNLLQEGDFLLQRLDASLQVQTGQSGSIHILQQFGSSVNNLQQLKSSMSNFLRSYKDVKTLFPKVNNMFNLFILDLGRSKFTFKPPTWTRSP